MRFFLFSLSSDKYREKFLHKYVFKNTITMSITYGLLPINSFSLFYYNIISNILNK